jgi:hypothetical protein
MTIYNQLEAIAATMETVDAIPLNAAGRLLSILNVAPAEALEMLVRRRVKFCWMPAANRLRGKFGYSERRIKSLLSK